MSASGIGVTYFTSYYALKQRANIQPGETLLVLGAGGGVEEVTLGYCVYAAGGESNGPQGRIVCCCKEP